MKMGREEESRHVLQATRQGDIEGELRAIKNAVEYELKASHNGHYTAMLFPKDKYGRQLRWRVFLTVWLQVMQELVGIGVVTVYAVDLFEDAGFSEEMAKLLAGFNNISYMFSVIFSIVTLDRYGRRGKYDFFLNTLRWFSCLTLDSDHGLGSCCHGSHSARCRCSGYVCSSHGTITASILCRGCCFHFSLHGHVRGDMAHDPMAIPNRDLPTKRACQRRCLVCCRVVNWQRYHQYDYTFSLSCYQLDNFDTSVRSLPLLHPMGDTIIS